MIYLRVPETFTLSERCSFVRLNAAKRDKMSKPILRMAAATIVAGAIAFAITAAPAANDSAAAPSQVAAPTQLSGKADRLRMPVKGTACSQHGWPNFEPHCQLASRAPAGEARTDRIIALR
jgi:hypothetical protein